MPDDPLRPAPDVTGTRDDGARGVSRRSFLRLVAGAGAVAAGGGAWAVFGGQDERTTPSVGASPSDPGLSRFAAAITAGGPPKDGIPPIDEPRFIPPEEADFLADDDVVFGLVHADRVRAYPQLVLVWHEIVNDTFPDGPLTVTYCPLTGSTVAFRGTAPHGTEPLTFGTSGDLVNSNLLMYDRQTDSRWPQLLGQAITGTATGAHLDEIPVLWTTWGRWLQVHPDTEVLSTDTGAIRNYGQDPYGSYVPVGGYYAPGSGLFFDVLHEDDRFDAKEVVIGVKDGDRRLAVPKEAVRDRQVVEADLGGERVAVLHDPELDEARAFRAPRSGLTAAGEGRYTSSGTTWDGSGRVVDGSGGDLERLVSYDVMWFSWVAFFPRTEVVS